MKININDIKALDELQKELNINDEVYSYIVAMVNVHGSVRVSKDLLIYILDNAIGSDDLVVYDIEGIGTVLNIRYGYDVWDAQYLSNSKSILLFSKDI